MTKVFRENVFFGAALIFSLSCLRLIKRKSPLIHFILWGSVLLVLFLIDTNFSYRSTHIIFLIICFFIIATDIHKRILFILICAFLTTSIPFIIGRVPYLLYDSDPGVIQMLRNVKKENSIIIALGSDNNIPAQLGYTTLDYIATFDTEYRKNALMDKTFQKLPTKIFIY